MENMMLAEDLRMEEVEEAPAPLYPLLYDAVQWELSMETLTRILRQAPKEAKCGQELFRLIKFAIEEDAVSPQILKRLVEQDTSCAKIRDEEDGGYLLHWVCDDTEHGSRIEVIQLLLEVYPQAARIRDNEGYLPLHIAAYLEEMPADAIPVLLDSFPQGAMAVVPAIGELPIHMAAGRWKFMTVKIMKRIVDAYPEGIRVRDRAGKLPLHYACRLARLEVIKFLGALYPEGAAVADNNGRTPLHWAHEHRTRPLAVLKFLLELNPDGVHVVDNAGMLPLHHTCGYAESMGSNLLRDSYYEEYIQHVSREARNRRYTDDYEALIQLLIKRYPGGLCWRDNQGRLPLHHACRSPVSLRILQTLLDQNHTDIAVADSRGFLPLHYACIIPKSIENIRFLVGMDPFSVLAAGSDGETPLQLASEYVEEFEDAVDQQEEVKEYLAEQQGIAVQAIRESMVATCEEIGLPDLVIARIWQFAKPNLWSGPR